MRELRLWPEFDSKIPNDWNPPFDVSINRYLDAVSSSPMLTALVSNFQTNSISDKSLSIEITSP
jgi:hypothetical protein